MSRRQKYLSRNRGAMKQEIAALFFCFIPRFDMPLAYSLVIQ